MKSLFKTEGNVTKFGKLSLWNHPGSTHANLSIKQAILPPDRHMYVCALGVKNCWFFGKLCVRIKRMIPCELTVKQTCHHKLFKKGWFYQIETRA